MSAKRPAAGVRAAAFAVLLAVLLAVTSGPVGADTVYKVVEPDGTVRYSDRPPTSGGAPKRLEFRHLPSSPLPESVLRFRTEMEKRMQARGAEHRTPRSGEVWLFTAPWCPHCRRAKADLYGRRVPFVEYDIDTPDGMAAFIQASGRSMPLLLTASARVAGYSESGYDKALASVKQP